MKEEIVPEWLRKLFGVRTAVQTGRENPVLSAAVAKSSLIYSQIPLRDFIAEETREKLSRQLYLLLSEISRAIDPLTVGREKLTAAILELALYQVLIIPPPPADDPSELRGKPGISGELKPHFFTLAAKNDELCGQLRDVEPPLVADKVWAFVQCSYWVSYWFLESINAMRLEIGDCVGADDWFRPFKHAACANREHIYRRDLGLAPCFEAETAEATATAYSILTDIILSGAENPLREWSEYYKDSNIPRPG